MIGGAILAVLMGVALTYVYFPVLWRGGGLVGGDIYTYFYPQKQFYGESLRAGEIPLWNNRTGHGYPTVGESQTGVFYPFHFLYAKLDLNTAYNAIQMAHYVIAFLGCWLLARRWGLDTLPSCLAAVVYVFGWLPTRICVEWAALGAAWFPWCVWAVEAFLQTKKFRYLSVLSLLLGLQMLAGHFHLAFITQLTLAAYIPFRLWLATANLSVDVASRKRMCLGCCVVAILLGFGLAAVQLGPTWELKQQSQRAVLGDEHDPGYGYIPWWYLGQMIAPWSYYDPALSLGEAPPGASRTNTVEAHLYCGLLPLLLMAVGCFVSTQNRDRRSMIWWLLASAALIYSTGTLMPIAKHLPGFGFFNGVGRYGVVVNLAVGLLAAEALQRLIQPPRAKMLFAVVAIAATAADCWLVSNMIQHTVPVLKPPLSFLQTSPIRKELANAAQPVRLFCRGANLPNLLDVSSTPVYLGLGPDAYFDPQYTMPQPLPFDTNPTAEQVDWLRRAGVTHILSFKSLDPAAWPIDLLVATDDPFLNRAWARNAGEPFFLYALQGARGRVYWADPQYQGSAKISQYRANSVSIKVETKSDATLVLADLAWPGWRALIDGRAAPSLNSDADFPPYRGVRVPAGSHVVEWIYRPASVWWGSVISLMSCVSLVMAPIFFRKSI